jgi:hypothetical protein
VQEAYEEHVAQNASVNAYVSTTEARHGMIVWWLL